MRSIVQFLDWLTMNNKLGLPPALHWRALFWMFVGNLIMRRMINFKI